MAWDAFTALCWEHTGEYQQLHKEGKPSLEQLSYRVQTSEYHSGKVFLKELTRSNLPHLWKKKYSRGVFYLKIMQKKKRKTKKKNNSFSYFCLVRLSINRPRRRGSLMYCALSFVPLPQKQPIILLFSKQLRWFAFTLKLIWAEHVFKSLLISLHLCRSVVSGYFTNLLKTII